MNDQSGQRRRGFTVMQTIVWVMLVAIVSGVASQLLVRLMDMSDQAGRQHTALRRLDTTLRQLRQDVWRSRRSRAPSRDHLRLTVRGERTIHWRLTKAEEGSYQLTRSIKDRGTSETHSITGLTSPIHFAVEGPLVRLERRNDRLLLSSQVTQSESNGS